jgi:hypothetical protein
MLLGSHDAALNDLLQRICVNLQLTPTLHQEAESRYQAIGEWLTSSDGLLSELAPAVYPQGSLAIGTTVRPRGKEEYDLDLVCQVQPHPAFAHEPTKLLDLVEERLREHSTYEPMVERKTRCIRVIYANEFHLDILPGCPDQERGGTCLRVPDRKVMQWMPSNPKGYVKWFEGKCVQSMVKLAEDVEPLAPLEVADKKATLKQIVQLLKRWRDIDFQSRSNAAPASIVLTTLAGHSYNGEVGLHRAFSVVLDRIASGLPSDKPLQVRNPTNDEEILSEQWEANEASYHTFRDSILTLTEDWHALVQSRGIHSIAEHLQDLFGEQLTDRVIKEHSDEVARLRKEGKLGASKKSGLLTASTSSAAKEKPMKKNTFYGTEEK